MATLTFPILPDGLVVDVLIGLEGAQIASLAAAGQPVPPPLAVQGLIDTGTDVTAVASAIIQRLRISRKHQATTRTVGGTLSVNLFDVSLSIVSRSQLGSPMLVKSSLLVMEMPSVVPHFDILIGLDILLGCQLFLDGPSASFTLYF